MSKKLKVNNNTMHSLLLAEDYYCTWQRTITINVEKAKWGVWKIGFKDNLRKNGISIHWKTIKNWRMDHGTSILNKEQKECGFLR